MPNPKFRVLLSEVNDENPMVDMLDRAVMCLKLEEQLTALQAAVRKHRDQRGDDRCWMDDEELYSALPEGYAPPSRDTTVELDHCRRFIECRRNPKTEYVSPEREIERLKAENLRLRKTIDELNQAAIDAEF